MRPGRVGHGQWCFVQNEEATPLRSLRPAQVSIGVLFSSPFPFAFPRPVHHATVTVLTTRHITDVHLNLLASQCSIAHTG